MGELDTQVLHVEDDKVDAMMIQRAFKKCNIPYAIENATNGIEALDLLRGTNGKEKIQKPRIILLDINMPKMNGLEFLKELRNDPDLKHISVFVITTSNDDTDKFEAYQLNVAGYILKPYSIENFETLFNILHQYWEMCVYPD
ncbi:MAG TPA: response regulator [Bacteroidia bacterium]|nr:response regulator [Bacteroidia bacterium]HNT79719.1 response regulator [Bacteroidia bacterium]